MRSYLIEHGVCYLTLADRAYPKKLAYQARTPCLLVCSLSPVKLQYLEELAKEFYLQNSTQTASASRPYAFIKFDTFIQKTKKLYLDTRTQRNVSKLQEELAEIQGIVTRNINDVLQSGERLEAVAAMGSALGAESRRYAARAKDLSRQALLRQWLPAIVIAAVVIGLLLLRAALRWLQR